MQQRRWRSGRWRAAAVLGAVLALPSCGDDSRAAGAAGALGGGGGAVTTCVPVAGTGPVVAADEALRNESTRAVTVDAVRLVDPEGLTLLDASLLPVRDRTLIGTSALPPASPVWAERRDAVGAVLAPGETWNLALTLERDGGRGRLADVEVAYTVGGSSSTHRLGYALTVLAAPPCDGAEG